MIYVKTKKLKKRNTSLRDNYVLYMHKQSALYELSSSQIKLSKIFEDYIVCASPVNLL